MACKDLQDFGGFWEDRLAGRCRFPIAPINTWSNLAYVIAGLLILYLYHNLFGILLILLGIGSGLYHGFKTPWADRLDNTGMYLVYPGLAVLALIGYFPIALMIGATLAWWFTWHRVPDVVEDIVMALCITLTSMVAIVKGHYILSLISLLLCFTAYEIWLRDQHETFWWPKWGHGIWHVLTAIGTFLLFKGIM